MSVRTKLRATLWGGVSITSIFVDVEHYLEFVGVIVSEVDISQRQLLLEHSDEDLRVVVIVSQLEVLVLHVDDR